MLAAGARAPRASGRTVGAYVPVRGLAGATAVGGDLALGGGHEGDAIAPLRREAVATRWASGAEASFVLSSHRWAKSISMENSGGNYS
jgi:hypothetical protein